VFLDGWAHKHIPELESFFTPWHAALYSGYVLMVAMLVVGRPLPKGYRIAVVGAAIFFLSGLGDMAWHSLFGVEEDIEALLSPTHLGLAIGGTLMLHAPFHAGWMRAKERPAELKHRLPMALSLLYTVSIISFITQFTHAVRLSPGGAAPTDPELYELHQEVDIAGIYFQTMFLMGVLLYAMKRFQFPFGSFFLIFTLNTFLMAFMTDAYRLVPGTAIAGFLIDVLYRAFKPSQDHPKGLHLWSFLTPALFYASVFLAIWLRDGIWWSVHLWTGAIVMPGLIGLMLSYLIVPKEHWLKA
jgi:hypothetical protein